MQSVFHHSPFFWVISKHRRPAFRSENWKPIRYDSHRLQLFRRLIEIGSPLIRCGYHYYQIHFQIDSLRLGFVRLKVKLVQQRGILCDWNWFPAVNLSVMREMCLKCFQRNFFTVTSKSTWSGKILYRCD